MEQRKIKSKFEIMSKGKLRIHMSLMIMENSGSYNILKGTVFDLLSFSVIKIAISGSHWKFETNKKAGLIFFIFLPLSLIASLLQK